MSRLREGRANTARGAGHFLRETVGRVRHAGARGNSRCGPTAASTLIAWYPSAARWMSASPSPSGSTKACTMSSRPYLKMPGLPFPTGWTAPPMWPRPPAELVSEVFSRTNIVIKTASNYGRLLVVNTILSSLASIIRMSLWSWTSETSSAPPSGVSPMPHRCGSSSGG